MNKRIRELHIQAQQEAWNEPIDIENCAVEDIKGFSQQVYEKFAELIVRECAEQIKTQGIRTSIEDYGDYEIGFNVGLFHALRTIKEHFGVEE
jgi:hypothetical protein